MIFEETKLQGAYVIDVEPHRDERGFFARSFCAEEFGAHGLIDHFAQSNVSFNARKGTLRGMHWQIAPHREVKLVRCTAGSIYDVIVDVREGSATLGQWFGVELSADNRRMLYIPEGFAHGFLSTADASEVFYQMSHPHAPRAARGFRYDDPAVAIAWPGEVVVISQRDQGYAPLELERIAERPA
ncbi:MAG: dTDP-4-dehydrorhamnose 3,5-epimerase [Myxococcota bacterium]|nr:dTDP-4-dehydrorhamnose 3,5-epimerase [Myxococcota bacterium]